MRVYFLISILGLTGCTTVSPTPSDNPKEIAELSKIVSCRIESAFSKLPDSEKNKFSGWVATYQIKQTTTDVASAGVNPLTWITPARVDKFLVVGDAGASQTAFRNGKAEFSVPVQGAQSCVGANEKLRVTPSDFHLDAWVSQVGRAEPPPQKFDYSVTVEVEASAGIGPDFANGRATATGGLSFKRTTNRTVDFAFASQPNTQPTEVVIVEDRRQKSIDKVVPRSGKRQGRSTETPPSSQKIPQSVILQNRQSIMGLELDRISPFGLQNR
ncbi:hypothetical protein ACQZ40_01950 [Agrobacterium sp. 16-172Ci]